jgi:hypothetical protein
MQTLTVYLPDAVYHAAASEAKRHKIDPSTLCSGLLSDHFLGDLAVAKAQSDEPRTLAEESAAKSGRLNAFDVAHEFRGFPHCSIEFAQTFVDEVLKVPHVTGYKKDSGIGFEPNFVFIESLLSRGTRSGIRVSFFGRPEQFKNPPSVLKMGRPPSYSRAVIETVDDLKAILPLIRESHQLRFGSRC